MKNEHSSAVGCEAFPTDGSYLECFGSRVCDPENSFLYPGGNILFRDAYGCGETKVLVVDRALVKTSNNSGHKLC